MDILFELSAMEGGLKSLGLVIPYDNKGKMLISFRIEVRRRSKLGTDYCWWWYDVPALGPGGFSIISNIRYWLNKMDHFRRLAMQRGAASVTVTSLENVLVYALA